MHKYHEFLKINKLYIIINYTIFIIWLEKMKKSIISSYKSYEY